MQSQKRFQPIRALFLLLVSTITLVKSASTSNDSKSDRTESDIVNPNHPRLLRHDGNTLNNHNLRSDATINEDITPWYHPNRMLSPLTTCPWPDETSLANVRSGQYGSMTGDCFYMYYDSSKCDFEHKCPLYVYVDGTVNAEDLDDRDSTYMIEMAQRGFISVVVDYEDTVLSYRGGCDNFHQKSEKIFDASVTGSVLHQLCYENAFGHREHIPVDCDLGVAVNGWSQGAHVASLAGNYAPELITAGLFWGNGNDNWACALSYPTCRFCVNTDVSCMNSNYVSLPKEKRRNISGARDKFFGACEDDWGANNRENVINQLRAISGYSCAYSRNNCFRQNLNNAGYFVIPEKGHNFMDVSPGSEFMDPETAWGLPSNLDWLAAQGRVVASSSGVCSDNSGITAGEPCSKSSQCQCGRWLQASANSDGSEETLLTVAQSDSNHRALPKDKDKDKGGDGDKPNPAPTPPPAADEDFCGCIN